MNRNTTAIVRTLALIVMLIPACGSNDGPGPRPADISGTWVGLMYATGEESIPVTLSLEHNGSVVTGSATFNEQGVGEWSAPLHDGEFARDTLSFMIDIRDHDPQDNEQLYFSGTLDEARDRIEGEVVDVHNGQTESPVAWYVVKQQT